jgi:hypothetical protein
MSLAQTVPQRPPLRRLVIVFLFEMLYGYNARGFMYQ